MKETQMPPAWAANLVANSGNTIYGVGVIQSMFFKILLFQVAFLIQLFFSVAIFFPYLLLNGLLLHRVFARMKFQ